MEGLEIILALGWLGEAWSTLLLLSSCPVRLFGILVPEGALWVLTRPCGFQADCFCSPGLTGGWMLQADGAPWSGRAD